MCRLIGTCMAVELLVVMRMLGQCTCDRQPWRPGQLGHPALLIQPLWPPLRLCAGLLGGAVYVNAFMLISKEVPAQYR